MSEGAPSRLRLYSLLVLMVTIWASNFAVAKIVVAQIPPLLTVSLRMLLAGIEHPQLELGNSLEREWPSSPGRQGFMMAVNSRNEMSGSVGGGIMEHKFVELAKSKLLLAEKKTITYQQFHDKAAARNQSGMICSGEQTIFMYPVQEHDQETAGEDCGVHDFQGWSGRSRT